MEQQRLKQQQEQQRLLKQQQEQEKQRLQQERLLKQKQEQEKLLKQQKEQEQLRLEQQQRQYQMSYSSPENSNKSLPVSLSIESLSGNTVSRSLQKKCNL